MERLDFKIIKRKVLEIERQSAADLEQTIDKARMQHNYRTSQLRHIVKLCDDNLKLRELEPKLDFAEFLKQIGYKPALE